VCAENLVRFDLMTESLNVGRDGRADIPPLELGSSSPRGRLAAENAFAVAQSTVADFITNIAESEVAAGPLLWVSLFLGESADARSPDAPTKS
jgi:hypothetical protein